MEDQLIETWNIHDRINRYFLDTIPDAALANDLNTAEARAAAERLLKAAAAA